MRRRRNFLAIFVVLNLLVVAGPVRGQDDDTLQKTIRENTTKLANLRAKIRKQQERMTSLADQATAVRRSHAEIQKEIETSRQLTSDLVRSENQLSSQSKQLAAEVKERRGSYQDQKQALAESLRKMYLRGQRGEMEMILTAENFSDLMTRMKVSRMMARLEAGVVENARRDGARIHQEQRVLDAALAEIWQTREEKRSENERLELLMAEQAAALRELETEQKGIKNSMLEYSLNEQKLNYILEELDQQRTERDARQKPGATASLAAMAGQLEWPVQGELIRGFSPGRMDELL